MADKEARLRSETCKYQNTDATNVNRKHWRFW